MLRVWRRSRLSQNHNNSQQLSTNKQSYSFCVFLFHRRPPNFIHRQSSQGSGRKPPHTNRETQTDGVLESECSSHPSFFLRSLRLHGAAHRLRGGRGGRLLHALTHRTHSLRHSEKKGKGETACCCFEFGGDFRLSQNHKT